MPRNKDKRKKHPFKIAFEIMERVRFHVRSEVLAGNRLIERNGHMIELSYTSFIEQAILEKISRDKRD